jgi:hypothetical protein
MKYFLVLIFFCAAFAAVGQKTMKIFDVHLHGSASPSVQIRALQNAGVYRSALSTSWDLQQQYGNTDSMDLLRGLMVPCPSGKVPYSLQKCFENNSEWPSLQWVEEQIKLRKIQFLGEVLSQYHGISSSDSMLMPYYQLAEKYGIPVGIHTGSAGPDHGCPNFSEKMGNPKLMEELLTRFSGLKVWIMHAGAPYVQETIDMMKKFPRLYTDVSAINNPFILPPAEFAKVMKLLVENGLEDRIMFGSDNGPIDATIHSINSLEFLTSQQKEKIFFKNAEIFFQ